MKVFYGSKRLTKAHSCNLRKQLFDARWTIVCLAIRILRLVTDLDMFEIITLFWIYLLDSKSMFLDWL
jgi:hypothetical protein